MKPELEEQQMVRNFQKYFCMLNFFPLDLDPDPNAGSKRSLTRTWNQIRITMQCFGSGSGLKSPNPSIN